MNAQFKQRRIFFALWPDDETRLNISHAFNLTRFSLEQGRNINPQNLHLTLHFLGNVSQEKFECVSEIAEQVKFEAFKLFLNQYDIFTKAKIFWMGATDLPVELLGLHADLGFKLQACGYLPEKRAFTPHVSLKRKVKRFEVTEDMPELTWFVDRFALVESLQTNNGVVYKPLKFYS